MNSLHPVICNDAYPPVSSAPARSVVPTTPPLQLQIKRLAPVPFSLCSVAICIKIDKLHATPALNAVSRMDSFHPLIPFCDTPEAGFAGNSGNPTPLASQFTQLHLFEPCRWRESWLLVRVQHKSQTTCFIYARRNAALAFLLFRAFVSPVIAFSSSSSSRTFVTIS